MTPPWRDGPRRASGARRLRRAHGVRRNLTQPWSRGSDHSVSTGIVQGQGTSTSTCRCRGARSSPWLRWCSAVRRAATGGAGSPPIGDLLLGNGPVARGDKVERGRGLGQWPGLLFAVRRRVGSTESMSTSCSSSYRPKMAKSACVCVLCESERE